MNSYLYGVCNVQTLLHSRYIQLNNPQIFAFYNDGAQWAHKPTARQEERASQEQDFVRYDEVLQLSPQHLPTWQNSFSNNLSVIPQFQKINKKQTLSSLFASWSPLLFFNSILVIQKWVEGQISQDREDFLPSFALKHQRKYMLRYFLIVLEAWAASFVFHYSHVVKLWGLLEAFELKLIFKITFQSGYITLLCYFKQESLVSDTCSPTETFALQTSEELRFYHRNST